MFLWKSWHCVCATVVGAGLTASCGTKSRDAPSAADAGAVSASCPSLAPTFESLEAGRAARRCAGLPDGLVLDSVASEAPVDAGGASSQWGVGLVDPKSGLSYRGVVGAGGVVVAAAPEFGKRFSCTTQASDSVSSTTVVPDALSRLSARGIEVHGSRSYYRAMGDCPGLTSGERIDVWVYLSRTGRSPSLKLWWDVVYDGMGRFDRICGPCSERTDPSCERCSNE
jgi:hypothetical protein